MARSVITVDANSGGILWDGIPPEEHGVIKSAVVRVSSVSALTADISVKSPGFVRRFHLNAPTSPARISVGKNDDLTRYQSRPTVMIMRFGKTTLL